MRLRLLLLLLLLLLILRAADQQKPLYVKNLVFQGLGLQQELLLLVDFGVGDEAELER